VSADPWAARTGAPALPAGRRRTVVLLAAGVFAALIGASLPLLRVIDSGGWVLGALFLSAAVLTTGVVARWFRFPGVAVAALEAAVWVLILTAMFGRSTALVWIIPTPDTFAMVPALISAGVEEIISGAAPLEAGTPLAFVLIGAVGLVALAIDHVVLTARMPLLAAVGLVAISLVPSIAVPGDIDLVGFLILSISILFLLRVDTRARQRQPDGPRRERARFEGWDGMPRRASGATATASAIGAVAVVVALVASPLLPSPVARAGSGGIGAGPTIDPTLELGDDLRQPRETEVLSVRSTAPSPPYLRAVTLSEFNGSVWEPDVGRTLPLVEADATLPGLEIDPDIDVSEYRTTVEITELNSPWLPVPYPAVSLTGLEGEWGALPQNRTVVTRTGSTQGQVYEVTSTVPRPTLEQIRARESGGDVREESFALPEGMPAVIEATAREVTAAAQNDFDALQSLQAWFRGPQFAYSLEAPVEDGFDGSGADAVADFLEIREGYCVHFASAFALMARTLGMPSRIVVGYLPGSNTSAASQGQTIYTVSSSQLHAWPEVHFAGIGWVPFEPTNSLGVPTSFTSAVTPGSGTPADRAPQDAQQPATEPSATPTTGARPQDDLQAGAGGIGTSGGANPWPGIGTALLVLAVLALPALLREIRRRRSLAEARAGSAGAAWLALQELAIDLGIAVPGAESPRTFGSRLIGAHSAPAAPVGVLVSAIEHASYAGDSPAGAGDELVAALGAVRLALRSGMAPWRRILATVAPRSLVIRPGSAYAHPPEPAVAR
jgi:transglutaminase-like putative cysteine protease